MDKSSTSQSEKKTDAIIQALALDLEPFNPWSARSGWMVSLIVFLFVSLIFAAVMPLRDGIRNHVYNFQFALESLSWFGMALSGMFAFVRSSLPGRKLGWETKVVAFFAFLLVASVSLRFAPDHLTEQALTEMDWFRGRCGPIIFITGLICAFGLGVVANKKMAPTEPGKTALWIGIASGALGSFLMQFVCGYENTLHILIWHILPMAILCGLSSLIGQRVLRW
jgi:hypothetical protein